MQVISNYQVWLINFLHYHNVTKSKFIKQVDKQLIILPYHFGYFWTLNKGLNYKPNNCFIISLSKNCKNIDFSVTGTGWIKSIRVITKRLQSWAWYLETFWYFTKSSFHNKWKEVWLLVINMIYTNCLTICQMNWEVTF